MKKYLLLSLVLFWGLQISAQDWVNLMQNHEVNFYEVQESFEEHWGDKGYERGKGWKQYKRWEDFMAPRVYPSGERLSGYTFYTEWKKGRKIKGLEAKTDTEWEAVGPFEWEGQNGWNPGLGRVNAIVEDPSNNDIVYVCTPSGGLWKSTDSGNNWVPLTDNLPAIGASGLAIDPTNTDILYLATGDGDGNDTYSLGVLKSEDGGETWDNTSLAFQVSEGVRCSKILMDPDNSQRLWVATHNGLYTTSDGGQSWVETINDVIRDIEINPSDPSQVYASGRRFYKSTDNGENFDQVFDGVPAFGDVNRLAIATTPANPNYVYMVAGSNEDSGFHGLYR
ncbi:MAG: hypothetical protein LC664_05790, partial [Flavobacteriales bacterium]|nr:hypothetical protein [Flavobacteriales bacterium]